MRAAYAAALCAALAAGAPAAIAQIPAETSPVFHPLPPGPVPTGQLDDRVTPAAYRLDLTIDPAQERFSGRAEIDVTVKGAPAHAFYIHGNGLAMRGVMARVGGRSIAGRWTQVDDSGVARLDFDGALPSGQPVTLSFEYDAPFNDGPARLFRAKVADQWHVWSQFQSIDARAAFPSFDQPSFKTPFTVTLRTPPGLMAVSNTPLAGVTREGGLDVHRFAETLPLPTYLVAIMVGPFVAAQADVPPTPQRPQPLATRIVTTAPNAGRMAWPLEESKRIVALLEDYFGDAFPYPKLDQISSPIMPGAMENAGAALYRDNILVMGPDAPTAQKRRFGMVVAHEIAHQWFGDLVTPVWWDDIWLNESFANWMGYRIGDQWRPELKIGAGALAEGFAAMDIDELAAGRPVRQPIAANAQIDAAFDRITYGKGGHVISMIAGFMGDATFRDGVRAYMKAHRHANATSDDFFAAMAAAAGDPRLTEAMRSFTDQQGVPLLSFTREGDGWRVAQAPYQALGSVAAPRRWAVPMCLRRGAVRTCDLLAGSDMVLQVPGTGALMPNAGGTGYYRFELPGEAWDALIADARGLDGGEALALADSLAASVRAGRSGVDRLVALARVLAVHPDSHAADAATAELGQLASSGILDRRAIKGWRAFVREVYRPLLARHGLDLRAGAHGADDPDVAQRRVQIVERLASSGRDAALRARLETAAGRFIDGDAAALDPQWFGAAFSVWLSGKGLAGARRLTDRALASEDAVFRAAALDAVAETGSRSVADWLLNQIEDPRLRPAEKRGFLRGVMTTRTTAQFGYEWMRGRVDELLSGNGGIFFSARMPQWLGRFCSVAKADELGRVLRPSFAGRAGALELERVIEKVNACGVLRQERGAAISRDFAALR